MRNSHGEEKRMRKWFSLLLVMVLLAVPSVRADSAEKAVLALDGVPEDTAWVEIDIGYGELARTLHIALTKEAGT